MRSFPRSWRFGRPSRNRMRSISRSACFISSIDSFFSYSSSFFRPQLPNIRACRKYWLIAVSSLNSTLFRCCTTLGSPFIGGLRGKARFDAEALAASTEARSGGCGDGFRGARLAQHLARAVTAATAAGANAELVRELIDRAGPVAGAFANGFFGHGIADADVQSDSSVEKDYHFKAQKCATSKWSLTYKPL